MAQARHLTLDNLPVNPQVARRLPLDMASRYHALPVAEDRGRVTVVMADPGDVAAREAVAAALGAAPYVVAGDPAVIDSLLAEVWPEMPQCSRRFLACVHANPIINEALAFTWAMGELLDAQVVHYNLAARTDADCDDLVRKVEQGNYDLVVLEEPHRSHARQIYQQAIRRMPTSLLVVRRPRWPLRRLLLVVRGTEVDDLAVDWVVRLAQSSGATVTALAVVPPMPAMYDRLERMQPRLDALLRTDTALGRQMCRVAQRLADWGIAGTLRLRQGAPDFQLQREVAEGDYDLITVAARPGGWQHWLLGEIIGPLMQWADRPVLMTKATTE